MKETLAQLTAARKKEQRRKWIESEKVVYECAEAQLAGKDFDPQDIADAFDAASRPLEPAPDLIDLVKKRIELVRITAGYEAALRRQDANSKLWQELLPRQKREIEELDKRHKSERAVLQNEDTAVRSIINAVEQARLTLQNLATSPEEEAERFSIQAAIEAVRREQLTLRQATPDHATLPGNPQWQSLLEREQRAERRLAWLRAKRQELPDWEEELELNDADFPNS